MNKKGTVLIVDDIETNRIILTEVLLEEYDILECDNGFDAIVLAQKHCTEIVMILLDIQMPEMDGYEVLQTLKNMELVSHIPVIFITASGLDENEEKGLLLGAVDYICKPFNPFIVLCRINNHYELSKYRIGLEKTVLEQTSRLLSVRDTILDTITTMVEHRSMESGKHVQRIRLYTNALLNYILTHDNRYGLTPHKVNNITKASTLHDIGKIGIKDSILLKPERLTPEEFEIMKTHTIIGCTMIERLQGIDDVDYIQTCYEICKHHHERFDGSGYPDKLVGDAIPLSAQVVAISDVYDALVTKRVYKPAFSPDKAIAMICNGECGVFSASMLNYLKKISPRFEEISVKHADD